MKNTGILTCTAAKDGGVLRGYFNRATQKFTPAPGAPAIDANWYGVKPCQETRDHTLYCRAFVGAPPIPVELCPWDDPDAINWVWGRGAGLAVRQQLWYFYVPQWGYPEKEREGIEYRFVIGGWGFPVSDHIRIDGKSITCQQNKPGLKTITTTRIWVDGADVLASVLNAGDKNREPMRLRGQAESFLRQLRDLEKAIEFRKNH